MSLVIAEVTNDDFIKLKSSLKSFIEEDPENKSEKIVKFVRMSFHDLLNYDPATHQGGAHGCLAEKYILDFDENKGLSEQVYGLRDFVSKTFPTTNFTFGDVISLAGKVAIETAYPCMQIKWRYGRSQCKSTDEKPMGPKGSFNTTEQFQPFVTRYGLTLKEIAILTAGSHGISGAAADVENSKFGTFDFSNENSGKTWIFNTISKDWKQTLSSLGEIQYETKISPNETLMRLPSDLLFFPSKLNQICNTKSSNTDPLENELISYTKNDRSVFDKDFEKVYAKMLEIGTNNDLIEFVEEQNKCEEINPTFQSNSYKLSYSFFISSLLLTLF
jgi:catalase (peroxidase I)